jgi:hypothetical protein
MQRNRIDQSEFRNSLFNEHYETFPRHRIFCHGNLDGFYGNTPPVIVHAHHIQPPSEIESHQWVNELWNGILLGVDLHKYIHTCTRHWDTSVFYATKYIITDSFDQNWRLYKNTRLANGNNFVETWQTLLIGKSLL